MFDDVRHALRRLASRPWFFVAAALTLTLGIGFNAAVFSLANLLLLRPLPVQEPETLVSLQTGNAPIWSYPNYLDLRDRNAVFTDAAAMRLAPMHLSRGGTKMRLWGYLVTGSYFEMLGVASWRGRLLGAEDEASAQPVAVLSYSGWQRRFGGDPAIVGSTVTLNEHPFTIIGIAPAGFLGTERLIAADLWVPFSLLPQIEGRDWREMRRTHNAWAVARLKPGISTMEAEASLAILAEELAREHPDANEGMTIRLAPVGLLGSLLRGPAVGFGAALVLVSTLTLLVACANLSNLLLAQATERRKELALRRSLGASRWALSRLLLAETLLLALAGCAGGLLAAVWLGQSLTALLPAIDFPLHAELALDLRVLGFTAAAAFASAALAGLLPALRSSAVDPATALRSETGLARYRRVDLRDLYVGIQVVVSIVLVSAALLMVSSLKRALHQRYGFTAEGAVTLRFDVSMHGHGEDRGFALQEEILRAAAQLPGIEACAISNSIPFSVDQSFNSIYVEGRPAPPAAEAPSAVAYQATPGLFRALGTRLLEGRDFDGRDRADSPPVVIVNETLASRLLAGGDPVGRRIRFGPSGKPMEIVGVAEAGKYQTVTEEPQLAVWTPLVQSYNSTSTLVARTNLPEREALSMLQGAIQAVAPELLLFDVASLESYLDLPTAPLRLAGFSLSAMGALAAILSALGLNALVAYSSSRRTREIGIRMALGAGHGRVLRALLVRTAALVAASAACGIALAFPVTGVLARLTYVQSSPYETPVAAVLMALVSIAAAWIPARRAVRIEPLAALRQE